MAKKSSNITLYKNKTIWGLVFVFAMLVGTLVMVQLSAQATLQPASASQRSR